MKEIIYAIIITLLLFGFFQAYMHTEGGVFHVGFTDIHDN